MSWNLTTSGAAIFKAGAGANTAVTMSGAAMDIWADQAEASLSVITRKDWVADYAKVTTNFKGVLSDVVSDMVAMKIINYDLDGYSSTAKATTMLDVLRDNITRNIDILKLKENQEVMD